MSARLESLRKSIKVLAVKFVVQCSFEGWCVQSEQHMRERRSGHCGSGQRIQVYTADMRCRVALQFYPDDYEWAEKVRSLSIYLHTCMQRQNCRQRAMYTTMCISQMQAAARRRLVNICCRMAITDVVIRDSLAVEVVTRSCLAGRQLYSLLQLVSTSTIPVCIGLHRML